MDQGKIDLDGLLAEAGAARPRRPEGMPEGPPRPPKGPGEAKGPPRPPGEAKEASKEVKKEEAEVSGNAGWIVAIIAIIVMSQGNSIWANLNTSALARGVQTQANQIGQINDQFDLMGQAFNQQASQIVQMNGQLSEVKSTQNQMQLDIQGLTSGVNSLNASVQSLQAQSGSPAPSAYAQPVVPQTNYAQPVTQGLPPPPAPMPSLTTQVRQPVQQRDPTAPYGRDQFGNPLPNGEPIVEFLGQELQQQFGNPVAPTDNTGTFNVSLNLGGGTY